MTRLPLPTLSFLSSLFFTFLVWHVLLALVRQLTGKPSGSCPFLADYMAVWPEPSQGVCETKNRGKFTNVKQMNYGNVWTTCCLLQMTGAQSWVCVYIFACVSGKEVCLCIMGQRDLDSVDSGAPQGASIEPPQVLTHAHTQEGGEVFMLETHPVLPTQITSSD